MKLGLLILMMTVSLWSLVSDGALGEHVTTISTNAPIALKASTRADYSVQEFTVDGVSIKEYINGNGTVFAVTWQGVNRPDLSTLLGTYHADYQIAKAQARRTQGRQPLEVKSTHLVVRHGGHMRDLHGLAYASDLVPASVSIEELE